MSSFSSFRNSIRNSLVAILLTLGGFSASAQATEDVYGFEDTDHVGVRLQLDYNHSSNWGQYIGWAPGFSLGVDYYAPFGKYTYFNGAALFAYDKFGFDGFMENKYRPTNIDGSMTVVGFKIPLEIGFKFIDNQNIRLSIYTGPRLYVNLSVKANYDKTTNDYLEKVEEKIKNSGMEIGWGGGVAVDLRKNWHAHVEYNQGLSNLGTTQTFKLEFFDIKRGEISIGLGYNF